MKRESDAAAQCIEDKIIDGGRAFRKNKLKHLQAGTDIHDKKQRPPWKTCFAAARGRVQQKSQWNEAGVPTGIPRFYVCERHEGRTRLHDQKIGGRDQPSGRGI